MEKYIEFTLENGIKAVKIENIPYLDIYKTFDCGQCFRFEPVSIFGNKYEFEGVAFGKYVIFGQNHPNEIIIYNATKDDYQNIWRDFLSLDTDYEKINEEITLAINHQHMDKTVEYGKGIRILKQDKWEALCSFIISQNNNIPRIKKIITALCEKYGQCVDFLGKKHYSFPSADTLLQAGVEEIFNLKTGFRAKYIIDACEKIVNGEIDLDAIYNEENFDTCVDNLCKIKGVGLKVASCALLFGFNKTQAFPIDVWIKRVIENRFNNNLDISLFGKNGGIAQQYLFYYERYNRV
ncbi:MAG: DNA-3-methyladenine glycosylase 2 family protein [Clostridia bacterium]|nr:DNA-3-methyladenine glycosylase 2 family protein [Clostridia bacterium]